MPRITTLSRENAPLKSLAAAIGSALGVDDTAAAVHQALHTVLESATPESRAARLMLIRHLADIEAEQSGISTPSRSGPADDFLSTAEAAELLGFSRPYVAMLIDQHQLAGAIRSPGGHRRVPRAAVLAWKAQHQAPEPGKLREEGMESGAYAASEAETLQRIRKLGAS